MKIVMVSPEMVPYAKTGGLADVTGALPPALAEMGCETSVMLPCYRGLEQKYSPEPAGFEVTVPVLDGDHWIDKKGEVLKTRLDDLVDVYLVKLDEYFDREALYTSREGDYPDNCARFTFFCRASLEFIMDRLQPDVIHCHDWQAALVPIYMRTLFKDDERLKGVPALTTIHNLGYQGIFWKWDMKLIGLPWDYFTVDYLEYFGKMNLLKGAIVFSDGISTVSKKYAAEIRGPKFGFGLEGVLQNRADSLFGIVNGIDYSIWSPEVDKKIAAKFSAADLSGKARCKADLQKEFGLPQKPDVPLVAGISRLVDQKGFDLVTSILKDLLEMDVQFVLLGTGDKTYENIFSEAGRKNPEKMGVKIAYNDELAHKIEAGADLFLMPSQYEPCGLNQLISLKYGTVPVVRATGGLDDTIRDWDAKTLSGNGFKFEEYTPQALWKCLTGALSAYKDKEQWRSIMANAMNEDHSWSASAKEYLEVYRKLRDGSGVRR